MISFMISTNTNGSSKSPAVTINSVDVSIVREKNSRKKGIVITSISTIPDTTMVANKALLWSLPLAKIESVLKRWFSA